jgi:hypothetical protein
MVRHRKFALQLYGIIHYSHLDLDLCSLADEAMRCILSAACQCVHQVYPNWLALGAFCAPSGPDLRTVQVHFRYFPRNPRQQNSVQLLRLLRPHRVCGRVGLRFHNVGAGGGSRIVSLSCA